MAGRCCRPPPGMPCDVTALIAASCMPPTSRDESVADWSVASSRRSSCACSRAVFGGAAVLVTDVTFVWPYAASHVFVTGTFTAWETLLPLERVSTRDGCAFVCSKPLPPGDYQYKFIVDNVWRHAPDQPVAYDERGIINNVLTVTVEACGDPTCFCASFDVPPAPLLTATGVGGGMTPNTMSRFTRDVGVAYQYVELPPPPSLFRKSYMHTQICDRPFNVTVVNIAALRAAAAAAPRLEEPTAGSISRAPSFDDLASDSPPPDPTDPDTSSSAPAASSSSAAASGAVSECPSRGGTRRRRRSSLGAVADVGSSGEAGGRGAEDLEEDDAAFAATLNNDRHGSLPRTAPYRAEALASDPAELACSVRARLSSPRLGFDPKECHDGIALLDRQHCAQRVQERGLYKTVRAVLPVAPPRPDGRVYFEFYILRQAAGGGVCVGLSTRELPLSCLCGTRPNSLGISTSGNIIRTVDGKESWSNFDSQLSSGCTAGLLVSLNRRSGASGSDDRAAVTLARVSLYVDGQHRGDVEYSFRGDMHVYPTLSIYARNARVYSLFDGADMLWASCLPPGDIYTLDGLEVCRDTAGSSAVAPDARGGGMDPAQGSHA